MKNILLLIPLLVFSGQSFAHPDPAASPLPLFAHAHNDFRHDHPLWDALHCGFNSIEVDVRLEDGVFFVAHDEEDISPFKTLETLYLDPLQKLVLNNNGSVYQDGSGIILLVDIKTDGTEGWMALMQVLEKYENTLTGSVTFLVSGNRDLKAMLAAQNTQAQYDGRLTDLQDNPELPIITLISANWTEEFAWTGQGALPERELLKLRNIVSAAHCQGRKLRFWATDFSDSTVQNRMWRMLMAEGVDFISTDKIDDFKKYIGLQ